MFNKSKPKPVETPMRDGWFVPLGTSERVTQRMMDGDGLLRSAVDVLAERQIDTSGTKDDVIERLAAEPDFKAQKGWLEEVVTKEGYEILFLPKFHCELNPIERVWGHAKRELRKTCDYTTTSITNRLPGVLNGIPVDSVRRYYRAVNRFVQAYQYGNMTPKQAAFIVKKYASHRRIPESAWEESGDG